MSDFIKMKVISNGEKDFEIYLESADQKNLIRLACIDGNQANDLRKSIEKCTNYVETDIVLNKLIICPKCKNMIGQRETCMSDFHQRK